MIKLIQIFVFPFLATNRRLSSAKLMQIYSWYTYVCNLSSNIKYSAAFTGVAVRKRQTLFTNEITESVRF